MKLRQNTQPYCLSVFQELLHLHGNWELLCLLLFNLISAKILPTLVDLEATWGCFVTKRGGVKHYWFDENWSKKVTRWIQAWEVDVKDVKEDVKFEMMATASTKEKGHVAMRFIQNSHFL